MYSRSRKARSEILTWYAMPAAEFFKSFAGRRMAALANIIHTLTNALRERRRGGSISSRRS